MQYRCYLNKIIFFSVVLLLSACASDQPVESNQIKQMDYRSEDDPWEGFNRSIFTFNDVLDRFVMLPLVHTYTVITPDPFEDAFARMFANMREWKHVFNDVLQLKFKQAGNDSARFVINTTLGIVGLFDVATKMGLDVNEGESFDQTLAVWGVPRGPYVVLPFFGPSSLRGAPGLYVDAVIHPVTAIDHVRARNVLIGWGLIDLRLSVLDVEEMIAGDRYSFIRDAYLQHQEYLINDGVVEDTFGGDFGEDLYDDEFDF